MCPTPQTQWEAEPGLGHGLLATGHSGNNKGKWNLSDEKVLTGRIVSPEAGKAGSVRSLTSKHRRAIKGRGALGQDLGAE